MYSLTDQIRRCSRSIGAQIAEAWGQRQYEKYFVSKLTDADGEQNETQHWLDIAADCEYINKYDGASSTHHEMSGNWPFARGHDRESRKVLFRLAIRHAR